MTQPANLRGEGSIAQHIRMSQYTGWKVSVLPPQGHVWIFQLVLRQRVVSTPSVVAFIKRLRH